MWALMAASPFFVVHLLWITWKSIPVESVVKSRTDKGLNEDMEVQETVQQINIFRTARLPSPLLSN